MGFGQEVGRVPRLQNSEFPGWVLFGALPGIGALVFLAWFLRRGDVGANVYGTDPQQPCGPGFWQSVSNALRQYADFSGRAGRAEYWYFILFSLLFVTLSGLLDIAAGEPGTLAAIATIVLLVPGLSAAGRRLHDRGLPAWLVWSLVPGLGALILLICYLRPGTAGANRFGADPLPPAIPGR